MRLVKKDLKRRMQNEGCFGVNSTIYGGMIERRVKQSDKKKVIEV